LLEFTATSDFDGDIDDVSLKAASMDAMLEPLDSRVWSGGVTALAGFDADNKLAFLSGSALDATLETVEAQPIDGQQSRVTAFRPLVDGAGTVTAKVAARDDQGGTYTYGDSLSQRTSGRFTPRVTGRYHRAQVTVTGGFDHAIGIEIEEVSEMGRR